MIKSIYFKETFRSQKELLKAICEKHKTIIDFKTKDVFHSCEKGQGISFSNTQKLFSDEVNKENSFIKSVKQDYYYPIINSTNWLDSHDDVHLRGCYKKTVEEQQGKVYFIDNHQNKNTQSIITYKSDIRMFYDDVEWKTLGKNFKGETQALIFEIAKENITDWALKIMQKEKDIQCSLAMKYGKIFFAVNSEEKEYIKNRDNYEKYKDQIINQEDLEKTGYFFGVQEIQIMGEGSMCPIMGGSNSATTIYQPKPSDDTLLEYESEEPLQDTPKRKTYLII
jgi:hypothetical protein